MSKIFRNILFNTALAVIVLHTIIPHPNSKDMVEKEHIKLHINSHSIYGILRLVFHESAHENLESAAIIKYNFANKTKVAKQFPEINSIHFNTVKDLNKKVYHTLKSNIHKLFIVKLNYERGPPLFTSNTHRI